MMPAADKLVNCLPPALRVSNAAAATNVIDTRYFGYMRVFVILGTTDIGIVTLKMQESDAQTDALTLTGPTDVPGTVCGSDPAAPDMGGPGSVSVLPQATDGNKTFAFEIDLRGRKRFLKPVIVVGNGAAGAFLSVVALLSRGAFTPTRAADKGLAQVMRIPSL